MAISKSLCIKIGFLALVFAAAVLLATSPVASQQAAVIFGTNTGLPKAITADSSGNLNVLINGGGGTFTSPVTISTGTTSYPLTLQENVARSGTGLVGLSVVTIQNTNSNAIDGFVALNDAGTISAGFGFANSGLQGDAAVVGKAFMMGSSGGSTTTPVSFGIRNPVGFTGYVEGIRVDEDAGHIVAIVSDNHFSYNSQWSSPLVVFGNNVDATIHLRQDNNTGFSGIYYTAGSDAIKAYIGLEAGGTGLRIDDFVSNGMNFKQGGTLRWFMDTNGDINIVKRAANTTAPGAGNAKFEVLCGTNAGTAKLVMYAGTSTTAVTVVDNVGAGVTGC